MKINRLIMAVLVITARLDYCAPIRTMGDIFKDVLNSEPVDHIQMMIQDDDNMFSALLNTIFKDISQTVPISSRTVNHSVSGEIGPAFRTYSDSLIIYLYVWPFPPDYHMTENIANIIKLTLHSNNRPRVLFIPILKEKDSNFEPFLKYMWKKRILDMTVFELSEYDKGRYETIIHQYNPFAKNYTKMPYSPGFIWFPNDLKNMHGYPIKMDMVHRTGHNTLKRNSQGYPIKFGGPDGRLLKYLTDAMNFTVAALPRKDEVFNFFDTNETLTGHPRKLETREVEMVITTMPFTSIRHDFFSHTQPVGFDNWCPVVPITYHKVQVTIFKRLAAIIPSIIILAVVWVLSIVLKFDPNLWQPLRIFGLIIGSAMPRQPSKTIERYVWLAIIFISSICTTNLYAYLTRTNIASDVEINYNTFEDLDNSGLGLGVVGRIFHDIFMDAHGVVYRLKQKTNRIQLNGECIGQLKKYKNMSCIVGSYRAKALIKANMYKGKPTIKVCKELRLWKSLIGYYMRKNSPYTYRVNEIISRAVESGIRSKWYSEYLNILAQQKRDTTASENTDETVSLNYKLISVLVCGYSFSILAFILEIVVYHVKNRITGKKVARN